MSVKLDPRDFASTFPNNFFEVWKFPLLTTGTNIVSMPEDAKLLHVGEQDRRVMVWALVRTKNPIVYRKILVIGTGSPMEYLPATYVGTVQVGLLVWHVFDKGAA